MQPKNALTKIGRSIFVSISRINRKVLILQYFSVNTHSAFIGTLGIKHFCTGNTVIQLGPISEGINLRIDVVP